MPDISLTTTAVTPTTTSLTTLRNRLRQELHDEDPDSYRWLDATLTRAVRELSLVLPREQKTGLTTNGGSHDVSIASLADLVRIEAVEYPTGQWPPSYVRFAVYGSTLTLLSSATPAGVEALNVFWGRIHTDGSTSTLPTTAEDAVVTGAAGYAALEWASFATNRANVTGAAAFEGYRALGEEHLQQFREALQAFGREARLRSASLYTPERNGAGQSTVQWSG